MKQQSEIAYLPKFLKMRINLLMKLMRVLVIKIMLKFKQNSSHHANDDYLTKIYVALHMHLSIRTVNMNKDGIIQSPAVMSSFVT